MFIGGPLSSISIAGRIFSPTADADVNVKLGGNENEIQMNGNRTGRVIQTPVASMLGGVSVAIDSDNGDLEFLQEIADNGVEVPVTPTFADGSVYSGKMAISGELQQSTQSASATFDLMGSQKLVQQ